PISTCASTTIPIHWPNSSGWSRSAASAGCISARSCRHARIRPGLPTVPSSMPPSKRPWRARHDGWPAERNRGPARGLPRRRRPHHACGRQRRSQRGQWHDARTGRRIRLRQERDVARHHGLVVKALRRGLRFDPLRRIRSARCPRRDAARPARQPAGDDLPGADDLAKSEFYHRRPDHRDDPAPSRRLAAAGARARHRAVAPRSHPLPRQADQRISAQALRRHAPARDDRDGAGLRPAPLDRGRADHRARRHPAGADPRPDARAEGRQWCRDHPDHPRPRRGRRSLRRGCGDVRRRNRRARTGRRTLRQPAASLHGRPARLDPAARPPRRASGDHRGHGAEYGEPASRLPFFRALPFRCRDLCDRATAAGHGEHGSRLALYPGAAGAAGVMTALLEVDGLVKHFVAARSVFGRPTAYVKAVDGVSFTVEAGKTLALVGESGCGKSTVSRLVLRLIEPDAGTVRFEGRDLLALGADQLRLFRRDAQIIFQDPYASLNPRMTVSQILTEPLALHDLVPAPRRRERVEELLHLVGLEPRFARRYPHEFSGGQRQRIAIARALAVEPKLIICDEPVSALDVSIRSQILNLLRDLQDRLGLAYIFVSHDLAVVKHIADRVAVMNLGVIVETAEAETLFAAPRHPYSRALLSAIPVPKPRAMRSRIVLQGEMPSALNPPPGCRFHTRCPYVIERCRVEPPQLIADASGHATACHRTAELPPAEAILPHDGGFS